MDAAIQSEFDAERAETIRSRSRWIWGVAIPVWLVSLAFVDGAVFTTRQALAIRVPELVLAAGAWLWMKKKRSLLSLEVMSVLTWTVVATLSGLGFLVIPVDKLPAKVASLELSALVICLVASLTWRANLVVAIVATLALSALPIVGARDLYVLSLTVVGFAYGVLVVSAAARDRLKLRELETRRALVVANEKLRNEDELRRRLFVNLSHDFRTPLAVIRGDASMLKEGGADPDESLARIERNASALADLADQLLDLARLEAGQMPVRARATDLAAIAREVAAQLGDARVRVEGEGVGMVDPAHATRILGNLVANALRQSPEPVVIRVAKAGDRARVDVVDEGPGVPADRREAIFTRFVSFDSDGSTASGIGLPLARELAAVNHGTLALVPDAAKTTFRLELPATDEAPSLPERGGAPALARPASAPRSVPSAAPRRLLVVEDNDDMAALLARALDGSFRVERAARVSAALDALKLAPPAAVLSDVMLPDGTGYDVLGAVRRRRDLDGVPVILLSALGDATERVRGLSAGADDYLPKPFDPAELRTRLASAIERAEGWKKALDAQRDALLMEVHDGVSASLARASILLAEAAPSEGIGHARDAIKDGLDEVRAITRLLAPRPTDFVSLGSEIRRAMADTCGAAKLALDFEVTGDPGDDARVPAAVAHTLRRVARESTTNIVKHAGASRVTCRLAVDDESFLLTVEDDGRGFPDAPSTGQGLGIMSRRVARVGGTVLHGAATGGKGARVEVRLPRRPA